MDNDKFNLVLAKSQDSVDEINKLFYGKFNYPWPPKTFDSFPDPQFGTIMLNQDIGCWQHDRIPENPKIWVAGCGTNQAIYTSLRFPTAEILGTDIAQPSLDTCKKTADQIGIKNLNLENMSINNAGFKDKFNYIICTGVIHHNKNPETTLERLAASLKPDGILELMVYNYYHRFHTTAFQKSIRVLCGMGSTVDFDKELTLTKELIREFPVKNSMSNFLAAFRNSPEAMLADSLLQPVEHSYTIESLESLVSRCNLELLLPCINQYDAARNNISWNLTFTHEKTKSMYESLPDIHRWQITNLFMFERSPMLWFYLQRKDSDFKRKSEQEVCQEFLDTKFKQYTTSIKRYAQTNDGRYVLSPTVFPSPPREIPADDLSAKIFKAINPEVSMRDVFHRLQTGTSFHDVNRVRINLTTSAFPYIKAE